MNSKQFYSTYKISQINKNYNKREERRVAKKKTKTKYHYLNCNKQINYQLVLCLKFDFDISIVSKTLQILSDRPKIATWSGWSSQ